MGMDEKNSDKLIHYHAAFFSAFDELEALKIEERRITTRKAQLQDTLKALFPLMQKTEVDLKSLGLSDAIRVIFAAAPGTLMTPPEVRNRLSDLGYDLSQFENPLASIHTALRRMGETGELKKGEDDDKKKFEAGPDLKPVQMTESEAQAFNALAQLGKGQAEAIGSLIPEEEKK